MGKNNHYRKLTDRDDFALKYYSRRSREFEKRKLRAETKKASRTQDKKEIEKGLKDYEESDWLH